MTNQSLKHIEGIAKSEDNLRVENVPVGNFDKTELLPYSYFHQYNYWKGIFKKWKDEDVEKICNKTHFKNYGIGIYLDKRMELIIPFSKENYQRLTKFYASRNVLIERGILIKEIDNFDINDFKNNQRGLSKNQ